MKISEQWLREWINPPISTEELATQLTMAGLEIESVLPVADSFTQVVIGHVVKVEKHPNADRLRVCQVNIGASENLNIVCGGANVRENLKVPVALVGAVFSNGLKIKSAKLRDVLSQGMICSTSELGLTETSEGIMELPEDAPIGKDFREWLQLNDYSIDVHVTPNRGDCLSIVGVAREVAVLNNLELKSHQIKPVDSVITDELPITVQAAEDCPRYCGRVIRGINPNTTTPMWMIERLRRSGLRSIHPVVDITNYVLLELGQPLHAFDLAKLKQGIVVRRAAHDEKIVLLDNQEVSLTAETLVIADKQQPQAIAGIMGGLNSAVTNTTTDIFLESAFFNPLSIAGRARRYGLNTDSGYRFERGVDPELAKQAIERATELLLQIVGGKPGPVIEKVSKESLPQVIKIALRKNRIEKLLGIALEDAEIEKVLQRLGMQLQKNNNGWEVTVPSYRFDLTIEEDLIEELVRIYGYDHIPYIKPQTTLEFLSQPEQQISLNRLRNLLIDLGYNEAITYSFIPPKLHELIFPQQTAITLLNPISADLAVMRNSLWPGLLNAVAYNQNRQQSRLRLFETGFRFIQNQTEIKQDAVLAGVVTGNQHVEQWEAKAKLIDFFDVKADIEKLLTATKHADQFIFKTAEHSALHPGQTAEIIFQNKTVGYIGALHPVLLHELDLIGPVYLFEIELSAITNITLPKFQNISKFPAMRRDISFWIGSDIPVQEIFTAIRNTAGEWLNDLCLFDVYAEKNDESKQRSLALGLMWQHPERTLVDTEVDELKDKVVEKLKQSFAVKLRD